uniref:Secreted protein n=1 Tax=Elaeophora elaphi TaxID=1147741 RepID=A0A0R3S0U8_9BILA
MFYIFVVVMEHLAQLWPLLLFAFTSIALCHLVARYTNISGSTITATLTTDEPLSGSTTNNGRNLLNKKEAPPSTIKESSESSQTIDDQDSDKDCGEVVKLLHFCTYSSRSRLTAFFNKRCFLSIASVRKLSVAGFVSF